MRRRGIHCILAAAVCVVVGVAALPVVAGADPILGDPCPNGDLRKTQGASFLPDCMALEQVTPQLKNNQPARILFVEPTFGEPQFGSISSGGDRVSFISTATLGGSPGLLDVFGDRYVSTREPGKGLWATSHTNPPSGFTKGWIEIPLALSFSADLSRWFQIASTPKQFEAGLGQVFRGGIGTSEAISPLLAPLGGTPEGLSGNVTFEARGSAADGSRLYFSGDRVVTYLPGDPTPVPAPVGERNTYIALADAGGAPSLQLLARDSAGKAWGGSCGARVGGNANVGFNRGAISSDGRRTYFTTRPDQPADGTCDSAAHKKRIMVREDTPAGIVIRELFPSSPGVGDDLYQGASIEGSKVFFTTVRSLVASDVDGATDLYLYDSTQPVGEQLTNVSGAGLAAPSVAVISGDGSHIYFNSTDVLTAAPGPEGKAAEAGQNNLYLYERSPAHPGGRIAFVAVTSAGSAYPVPVLGPDPNVPGVGGDGHLLFFTSPSALTGDDTDGGFSDVFRYDARDGTLVHISKAAPGGSEKGPVGALAGLSLAGGQAVGDNTPEFVVRGRWVSEDGETVAFKTGDGLVGSDNNGIMDSYFWREGRPFLLPGTEDPTNGLLIARGLQDRPLVSLDGETVAFQTYEPLLPRDGDSAVDAYVARAGGGFPEPVPVEPCVPDGSDGCQGQTVAASGDSSVASTIFSGHGNLVEREHRRHCPKGKRKVKRNGKVRCVKRVKRATKRRTDTNRRAGR